MRSFFSVICLQLILQCTIDMFGRFILLKFRSFTFVSTCYLLLTAYCSPHHHIITPSSYHHHITIPSPYHPIIPSPHYPVTISSSHHHIITSSYHPIITSSHHHIIISSYHHITHLSFLISYLLPLTAYCLLLTAKKNRTGHFSRNSLPETIKLKNTRLVVSSFVVFGGNPELLLPVAPDLFLF